MRILVEGARDNPSEFLAFVVWYIFLVICCLIPTCCAYRRRRMMERRLAEQQATMHQRLQQSNLLFLSNLANESGGVGSSIEQVRTQMILEDLKSTTMSLKAMHFVDSSPVVLSSSPNQNETDETTINDQTEDVEAQMENSDTEEYNGLIRLPKYAPNANEDDTTDGGDHQSPEERLVSDTCTICLCQYIEGESITWSARPECVHAFHTQCIVSCKSNGPLSNVPSHS
jgi:hypothetical protein